MYSVPVAYLLWLCSGCGALGFHRFYMGKTVTGVLWLMTGGLGMAGAVYDFFTLPRQIHDANYREGMRRAIAGGAYGPGPGPFAVRPDKKESIERTILRVAKKNAGIATPSEVALEGDIPIEEAKAALEKIISKGYAELKVRKSGAIVYAFPEFMEDRTGFEEF